MNVDPRQSPSIYSPSGANSRSEIIHDSSSYLSDYLQREADPAYRSSCRITCETLDRYDYAYYEAEAATEIATEIAAEIAAASVQGLQHQTEREHLLAAIALRIRRSLDLDTVLNSTVTEVRQLLQTDRVLIYRFEPDWSGVMEAESVGAGWKAVLETHLKDLCFITEHLDRYQQGCVQVIEDIYAIGLQSCHIELLSQFQVRANLVVPIVSRQRVWGLLIAQHCQSPREWQQVEVDLLKQLGDQVGVAVEHAEQHRQVQRCNAELKLQMQQQIKELAKLDRLKEDFLKTLTHELRTPITSISLAAQTLETVLEKNTCPADRKPAIVTELLDILHQECARETQLINNLLALTYLDAEPLPKPIDAIDLQAWVPSVVSLFEERALRQQQQIHLVEQGQLPTLTTDLAYLERILNELLTNACKFTPASERIIVSASASDRAVQLSITSTGVEIAPEEQARLFDAFYRIQSSDPWQHGGTGLGLALVQKLVKRLGAAIYVLSENKQTTFTVEFPHQAIADGSKSCGDRGDRLGPVFETLLS